jgi:hypothetical protein
MSEFKPVENPVFTYTLNRKIQFMGEAVEEISIREPTMLDLTLVGNPFKITKVPEFSYEIDQRKALKMLSQLSGLTVEGCLERLYPSDAIYMFEEGMLPFFVGGWDWKKQVAQQENSPNTTTSTP